MFYSCEKSTSKKHLPVSVEKFPYQHHLIHFSLFYGLSGRGRLQEVVVQIIEIWLGNFWYVGGSTASGNSNTCDTQDPGKTPKFTWAKVVELGSFDLGLRKIEHLPYIPHWWQVGAPFQQLDQYLQLFLDWNPETHTQVLLKAHHLYTTKNVLLIK